MARLIVHVEGPTEESFVKELLRRHLLNLGYESVSARIIGNSRLRLRRGGIRPWPSVKGDIVRHLRQDNGCIATTMVDFYGLPQRGDGEWPGRLNATALPIRQKGPCVENAMLEDISNEMGRSFDKKRFVPFVVVHEFEGLLFSNCAAFASGIGRPELAGRFQSVRDQFESPEAINDSPETAPSKRVQAIVAGYQKPLLGVLAALEIGLENIRTQCPHFADWLASLALLV